MKIKDLPNAPDWLLNAKTFEADVEIVDSELHWFRGDWLRGNFENGHWHSGRFLNGTFKGRWHTGNFLNGSFAGTACHSIRFFGGTYDAKCKPENITRFI